MPMDNIVYNTNFICYYEDNSFIMFNPEIFRAYDIRGIYGKEFDDGFAFALGQSVAGYFQAKKILIARDSRPFSEKLSQLFARGANSVGCDVEDIGVATTPFFNFVLKNAETGAGVIMTASHNPPEYGGFKVYDKSGGIIGLEAGLDKIRNSIQEKKESTALPGKIINLDSAKLMAEYVKYVISKSKVRRDELSGIKIKIAGPSAALKEIELISKEINLNIVQDNFDISFSFDGDSDRLAVTDKNNEKISTDMVVGLLVKNSVRFLSKPRVVYDVHFSKGVISKFKEWGIKSYQSKVGRFYLRDGMIKRRADIGGEISGHIYFKENNQNELPLLAVLKLLRILALSKRDINEMVKPFQTWLSSGRIDFKVKDLKSAKQKIDEVEKKFSDGKIDKLDGVSVEYTDPEKTASENFWWFNLRASNTEPLLRLFVEAKTKNLLDEKVSELKQIISQNS